MTITLIVSGIVAPALLWIGYFYYKDRFQPEPYLHMGLTYILGLAAGYVCFKSYGLLSLLNIPPDPSLLIDRHPFLFFLYCIGVVGFLEEIIKFLPFILLVVRLKAFDEEIDGMIYASVLALGFASYENLHYLPLKTGFTQIGRAMASPLTHTIFSSIWGHMVGTAIFSRRSKKAVWGAALKGIVLASLLHGIFDFFTLSPFLRFLSALVILAIWIWRIRLMEILHKKCLQLKETSITKNVENLPSVNSKEEPIPPSNLKVKN